MQGALDNREYPMMDVKHRLNAIQYLWLTAGRIIRTSSTQLAWAPANMHGCFAGSWEASIITVVILAGSTSPDFLTPSWSSRRAVGLMSQAVQEHVSLVLRTGRIDDPQPEPISMKCWGGSTALNTGNSRVRYRRSLKKWPLSCWEWKASQLLGSCMVSSFEFSWPYHYKSYIFMYRERAKTCSSLWMNAKYSIHRLQWTHQVSHFSHFSQPWNYHPALAQPLHTGHPICALKQRVIHPFVPSTLHIILTLITQC